MLVAFGGAGGLHAASVARHLGMKKVLIPEDAGLLSAYGIGHAPMERFAEKQVLLSIEECEKDLARLFRETEREATLQLRGEKVDEKEIMIRDRLVFMRFREQESSLEIPWREGGDLRETFLKEYRRIFGHWNDRSVVEIESIRVIASTRSGETQREDGCEVKKYVPQHHHTIRALVRGKWMEVPVFLRKDLKPGAVVEGFALLLDAHSTTVVNRGWTLIMDRNRTAVLTREEENGRHTGAVRHAEVTELELFINRFPFIVIARNMGSLLQRTAMSVNIKERMDFSCALLSPKRELVVNAPHIPVHLGSLGVCVRKVREYIKMEPGDTVVTNHPAYGGFHLPECLLNPPFPEDPARCPAIVGGNVEVSQRLTDTLLKPFGILACSQGTMNNVLFGDDTFSYYETICGGCGAGPGFDGASAVHHHMTNTRITDPEVMEYHYPVRLERFEIRRGSGGQGRQQGGDGAVREIRFLKNLRLSVLTQHRSVAPYGLDGGNEGETGSQTVIRKSGAKIRLKSIDGLDVFPGDRLVIETPGGGGFGKDEETE